MVNRGLLRSLFTGVGLCAVLTVCLAGEARSASITRAVWNSATSVLQVAGTAWGQREVVSLSNAGNGSIIGTVKTTVAGSFTVNIRMLFGAPCSVEAISPSATVSAAVTNAPATCAAPSSLRVFAFNNLGMHCYDSDYSVFSILPPFNTVNAQVLRAGTASTNPVLLDNTQATLDYSAIADRTNSINTTSANKTNFWTYVTGLFGVTLPVDQGLTGSLMPGATNTPMPFSAYDATIKWFTAEGIPITGYDDMRRKKPYPLMSIQAHEVGGTAIPAPISVVLPVSDEMHCSDCHNTGGKAASNAVKKKYSITSWSKSPSAQVRYRQNILILHDARKGTTLVSRTPVLCASCHYSPALDLTGAGPQGDQVSKPMLSMAVHGRHGKAVDGTIPAPTNPAIVPDTGVTSCYKCHPGSVTKCLRGAMGAAGITCQNCHGGMLAVGGAYAARTPWVNEPKCQSCHTGDDVSHLGTSIRSRIAYNPADPSATPITATNQRFAEEAGKLYRNSAGHGGMACEACHGSTHAEWPTGTANANDNVVANQIQGHAGPITECAVCHAAGMAPTVNGPHGLHNVNNTTWNRGHSGFFEANQASCQACHGTTLGGTVLSRAATSRILAGDDNRTVSVAKGTQISCTLCHENPLNGGGNRASGFHWSQPGK